MRGTVALAVTAALFLTGHAVLGAAIYVAPQGNDANPGTKERPFVTLSRARDEIRNRKAAAPLSASRSSCAVLFTSWHSRSN